MSCSGARPAPLRCPTLEEILSSALALLPRGRAWQTNEGGPRPGSVVYGFFLAVASLFKFLTDRLCALRFEFFCSTHAETHAEWMEEYGLPDPCDPFPDLCVKVAAIGAARCEYYSDIASRLGWQISCDDDINECGARAGCGAQAGCATPGGVRASRLVINVYIDESPAFTASLHTRPFAGALRAGLPLSCEPDISPLECLLSRVVHAHIAIEFRIVRSPVFIMVDAQTHIATETGDLLIASAV